MLLQVAEERAHELPVGRAWPPHGVAHAHHSRRNAATAKRLLLHRLHSRVLWSARASFHLTGDDPFKRRRHWSPTGQIWRKQCAHHRPYSAEPEVAREQVQCDAGVPMSPLWLQATDGQRLYAVPGGGGDVGVVLAPESASGDVCGWLPYLATLQNAGFRVMTRPHPRPLLSRARTIATSPPRSAAYAQTAQPRSSSWALLSVARGH